MDGESNGRTGPSRADGKYLAIVGGLLLTIIVALAVLWLSERRGRLTAEAEAARLRRRQRALQSVLPGLTGMPGASPIRRDDLQPTTRELDGRQREVFTISAAAGERLGFEPGDVVEVAPATTTRPKGADASLP